MENAVLITGAGGGIGVDVAQTVARGGSAVFLVDHRPEGIARIAAELCSEGFTAIARPLDVTDEDAVAAAVEAVRDELGRIDGLVNCAATMSSRPLTETTLEDWQRVLSVNATGTFLTCKHVVRALVDQGTGGSIVNLSSISGTVGLPSQPAYAASKGAVLQLTRQIAVDYAARGIRCNAVSPGSVDTDQLRTYLGQQADPVAAERALIDAHPLRRFAGPAEISSVIAFLLGAQSGFITGADIPVDGGYTAV